MEVDDIRRAVFRFYQFIVSLWTSRDKRLILLSAILFSAGFAPLPFGFLAYVCLVPLFIVTEGKGFWRGFRLGYLFGFELSILTLYWVAAFALNSSRGMTFIHPTIAASLSGGISFVAMAFLHSFFYAAVMGVFSWLRTRHRLLVISLPIIWCAVEYIRTLSQFAFPWTNLSYTQSYYLPLIQTADIWGDIGISFWIAVINLLLFLAWKFRHRLLRATVPVIMAVVLFVGALLYDNEPENYQQDIKVALLQGSFPLRVKWDRTKRDLNFQVYDSLARESMQYEPDLIVWPETAAPMYLRSEPKYFNWARSLAIDLQTHMLVGTLTWDVTADGTERHFNGCYQFNPEGTEQRPYNKIELVPFSEKVPYADYFPLIKKIQLGQSDFTQGDTLLLFELPKGEYAVLICFELAFSDLARQFVNSGADFLVTITNDTWFGKTSGPYQHMQMAIFRAIENRSWVARCANSGFTFTVDPYGRKFGTSELEVRDIVYGEIGKVGDHTFFTKYGLWLPQSCLVVTFLFLFAGLVVKLIRK